MKTFEVVTKKSKRRNLLKTIGISLLTCLGLTMMTCKGLAWLTARHANELRECHQTMMEISYPNVSYINWSFIADSEFTGTYYADQVKDIAGITVPFEDFQGVYGLSQGYEARQALNVYLASDEKASYTYGSSYKVPMFYNIHRNYHQMGEVLTQDITALSQMPNRAVEMAVTFDKPYTFDEIQTLIPDNLKIKWYWIGTETLHDTRRLKLDAQIGFQPNLTEPETYEEMKQQKKPEQRSAEESKKVNEAYQKKLAELTPSQGFRNSYTFFQAHLQEALSKNWLRYTSTDRAGEEFDLTKDVEEYLEKNPDGKTAKFAGVILTGRAEDFASLEKASWIFASNIGQDVEIKPYHQLSTP